MNKAKYAAVDARKIRIYGNEKIREWGKMATNDGHDDDTAMTINLVMKWNNHDYCSIE